MKIMWYHSNAFKGEGVAACLVPDDYAMTEYDRTCAVAPPFPINSEHETLGISKLMELYPCPQQQTIAKLAKKE